MFNFVPHKEKFFDLFKESAQNALAGARALKEMLDHYDNPQDSWKKLKDLEHEGDRITHRTIRSLNQTFLTPIDALGQPMVGTLWRCAVLIDGDARILSDALAGTGVARRDRGTITAALAWKATGSVRVALTPLMPHENATCAGAAPPLF